MKRGILIDVKTYEISEVYIDKYTDFYPLLRCNTFDVAMNFNGDISAFVDDDGLFVSQNPVVDISGLGFQQPYAGSIVLMGGVDADGETMPLDDEVTTEIVRYVTKIVGETR